MGFIPQFKNDLFVSYRHAANEGQDHWVDAFCEQLRARLKDLVDDSVTIWRDDPKILAGEDWRKKIDEAVDTAAIFLAILSKTYLDSEVCRRELDRFLGRAKIGGKGALRRIIPIYKHPARLDAGLPQEVTALQDHRFFDAEPPPSTRFRELRPGPGEETAREFSTRFERLVQDLMVQLETLKGIARQQAAGTLFLARVGPELHDARERVRSDLQQRGYLILPEHEYLWNASELEARMADDLDHTELCVHLIGRTASIEPESFDHARLQLDRASAAMAKRSLPPPLVWIQPAGETHPDAASLVAYVQQELANQGVEYWEGGLEDFKTQIYDKLPRPGPVPAPPAAAEVYILAEEGDLAATRALLTLVTDHLKLEPRRIFFAGAHPKSTSALATLATQVSPCVVVWGSASEEWVGDILALDALRGRENAGAVCVYALGPATADKDSFRSRRACVIRAWDAQSREDLERFLAAGTKSL